MSTFALEELGKLNDFSVLDGHPKKFKNKHADKQHHLGLSGFAMCWFIAVADVLKRPLEEVFHSVRTDARDARVTALLPESWNNSPPLTDLSESEFSDLWNQLVEHPAYQLGAKFANMSTDGPLPIRRHAALYVDHCDGKVIDPHSASSVEAKQLIDDTETIIEYFKRFMQFAAK